MSYRIVFIGAGNLATRLSLEFKKKGYHIEQVYSRSQKSANQLAIKLRSHYTTTPWKILPDADIYFVALKDSAFEEVLPHAAIGNRLLVHCSGSMPLSSLKKYSKNTGVFYPLQTFSKTIPVKFDQIPVFIEANTKDNEERLLELAGKISDRVSVMDSESRLCLHVAAVFACNFVNHLYTIASEILKKKNIPFEVLQPLILETAKKIHNSDPALVQTGPAVRFDRNVISTHLNALDSFPEFRELYANLSDLIFNYHKSR
ncbi:MAG: DUF2520 domain-containing protein [Bacteroidales bacterium]|nr:DUF2520 domain-containing protein [Bacteroidales bacterium]